MRPAIPLPAILVRIPAHRSLFAEADEESQVLFAQHLTEELGGGVALDFDGDGKSDILLQNVVDGSCYVWELNGTSQLVDNGFVGWTPGKDWVAKGTGDFNGDGKLEFQFTVPDNAAFFRLQSN